MPDPPLKLPGDGLGVNGCGPVLTRPTLYSGAVPDSCDQTQAAEPGEFFKTAESHYSHAQRVDASRHMSTCSASNVPDSALNQETTAHAALNSALYYLTVIFAFPLMVRIRPRQKAAAVR